MRRHGSSPRAGVARNQRGMGIVELMVALLIGLVMAVALAWFYLGSRALSRTSDDVSRLQESGRGALEIIGMAVRQAGYRSNVNSVLICAGNITLPSDPSWKNCPLNGQDGTTVSASAPDSLTVRFSAQDGGSELDCTGAAISTGSMVTYAFTIDRSTNPPGLQCNGQRVVDNVEDMQITYGIDADHDGQIELYKTQPTAAEFLTVAAVRVALLVRGPSTMISANKSQTIAFNGNTPTYTDGYLRQAYTGTFSVRPLAY